MTEKSIGKNGRIQVGMEGLVLPQVVHNKFIRAIGKEKRAPGPPLAPHGGIFFPNKIIVRNLGCFAGVYRQLPVVAVGGEHRRGRFVSISQPGQISAKANLLSPGRVIIDCKL